MTIETRTAICRECGRRVPLTYDGNLVAHTKWGETKRSRTPGDCDGSHTYAGPSARCQVCSQTAPLTPKSRIAKHTNRSGLACLGSYCKPVTASLHERDVTP